MNNRQAGTGDMMPESGTIEKSARVDGVIDRIRSVIETDVRPFIEMDGGKIEFVRFTDGVVYVRLAGACVCCPSSSFTLKEGVERSLCKQIEEVSEVRLENTDPDAPDLSGFEL